MNRKAMTLYRLLAAFIAERWTAAMEWLDTMLEPDEWEHDQGYWWAYNLRQSGEMVEHIDLALTMGGHTGAFERGARQYLREERLLQAAGLA